MLTFIVGVGLFCLKEDLYMIKVILTSLLMGIGLAMDACAVSMANGLKYPKLKLNKLLIVALMFGLFQGLMPLIGYFVGSAILSKIEWIIPIVAIILLSFVGIRMIIEGVKCKDEGCECCADLTFKLIFIQAVATSIDALSVGFSIADYSLVNALTCTGLVALVTFIICFFAVFIGKKFGDRLGCKAQILGGIILVAIGIEIFVSGMFF